MLRAGTGNNIEPSFYYSWKMPGDVGGDFYRENIADCNTDIDRDGATRSSRSPATWSARRFRASKT